VPLRPNTYWQRYSAGKQATSSGHALTTQLRGPSVTARHNNDQLVRTRFYLDLHVSNTGTENLFFNWWNDIQVVAGVWWDPNGSVGITSDAPDPIDADGSEGDGWLIHEEMRPVVETIDQTNHNTVIRWTFPEGTAISETRRNSALEFGGSATGVWHFLDTSFLVNHHTATTDTWLGALWTIDCAFATEFTP
jgi:hypothetical protein